MDCLTTRNPAAMEQAGFPVSGICADAGAMPVRTTGSDLTRGRDLAFLARPAAHFWTRFRIENRPMEKPRTGDDAGPLRFQGEPATGGKHRHRRGT